MNTFKSGLARPVELIIYASCAFASIAFYFWLRQSPPDAPVLLLAPISRLSGLLTGVVFTFLQGVGYSGISLSGWHIVIEKSCSGGNFLIILFSLLTAVLPRTSARTGAKLAIYAGSFVFSYIMAIIASSLRIAASILTLDVNIGLSQKLMHNMTGIMTYLAFICVSYLAAQSLLRHIARRGSESNG